MLLVVIAGGVFAEWPTSTEKPEHKFNTWDGFPLDLEPLVGDVIEMTRFSSRSSRKDNNYYRQSWSTGTDDSDENYQHRGSYQIKHPEEGLLSLRGGGTAYLLVTGKDDPLVVIGNEYIKNKDGTVQYVWSETDPIEVDERSEWRIEEVSLFGKFFSEPEPVIYVRGWNLYYRDFKKDESAGELSFPCNGMSVVFPQEAEEWFLDNIESSRDICFYAKLCKTEDGELMLQALGDRRRGKGDKATYKW